MSVREMEDALVRAQGDLTAAFELLSVQAGPKMDSKSKKSKKSKKSRGYEKFLSAEDLRQLKALKEQQRAIKRRAKEQEKQQAKQQRIVRQQPQQRQQQRPSPALLEDVLAPSGILVGRDLDTNPLDVSLDFMITGVAYWATYDGDREVSEEEPYLTQWILKFPKDGKPLDKEIEQWVYAMGYEATSDAFKNIGTQWDHFSALGQGVKIPGMTGRMAPKKTINGEPTDYRFVLVPDSDNPDTTLLAKTVVPREYRDIRDKTVMVKDGVDVPMPSWFKEDKRVLDEPRGPLGSYSVWPKKTMVIVVPYTKTAEKGYMANFE